MEDFGLLLLLKDYRYFPLIIKKCYKIIRINLFFLRFTPYELDEKISIENIIESLEKKDYYNCLIVKKIKKEKFFIIFKSRFHFN